MISVWWALVFALINPVLWGFMNILDKYVLEHRVKNPLSFAVVAGNVVMFIGIVLALFLSWDGITIRDLFFPALAGILLGSQYYFYYVVLKKEDVSRTVGLLYVYPLVVALLSFLFLNELISLIGYLGMALILTGALLLSLEGTKIKFKAGIWIMLVFIIVVALYEFFIKIATENLPSLNGIAVNSVFIGLTVLPLLFNTKIRKGFRFELKNWKWALLNESFTFLGIATLYFAMEALPATVVSSVAAIQPLCVLFLEIGWNKISKNKLSKKFSLSKRLIPIALIVLGVILLYSEEILRLLG